MRKTLKLLPLASAALLALIGPGAAARASVPTDAATDAFTQQAKELGLNGAQQQRLQSQVDREVRSTDGRQIAINEVHWRGGNTVFVLPGETRARHLADGVSALQGTVYRCPPKYFCNYRYSYWEGTMHELYRCTYYRTPYPFTSWVNNQTKGTKARFYDSRGKYIYSSYPAPWEAHWDTDAWKVWSIKPC
jgi:hypothetical protein